MWTEAGEKYREDRGARREEETRGRCQAPPPPGALLPVRKSLPVPLVKRNPSQLPDAASRHTQLSDKPQESCAGK